MAPTYLYACCLFFICVFQNKRFNRFLWFLAYQINNDGTLRKCYLFSCRHKNLWDIGIYLKPHFYEKCKQLRNPTTDFPLTLANKPQSSLVLHPCKFEGNRDRRTRCTKSWSNLTLKYYTNNTSLKVTARIEVECRQNISYRKELKGYSYLKLYCKKQSNQKPTANIVSTTRRTTLCWVRGNIKELLFIKLTLYLSLSFGNKS